MCNHGIFFGVRPESYKGDLLANIIVTGVDGSETATLAARSAAEIAEAFQASLHIVSAFGPGDQRVLTDGEGGRLVIDLRHQAEGYVAETAEVIQSEFPNVELSTAAANEAAADALVSEAERLDARLIVVGNKRVQGPTRILGSVARTVAANASCDVYVVNTRPA